MKNESKTRSIASLRIVAVYAVVGALWIFFSDSLLALLVRDPETMSRIAIAKGWMYVAVTAALLYFLISKTLKVVAMAEEKRAGTELRYRTLFEHSGDALMVHAPPHWTLSDANPAALNLFGYLDLKEFLATHPADLSPATQPDGETSRAKSERLLASADRTGNSIFKWRCKRKDSTEFDAIVKLTRIDFDGTQMILAAVRDVTELNRIEEERKEIERRLMHTQKLESLGVLVSGIAHDFNNLLSAAGGNLEIALLSENLNEQTRDSVMLSRSALDRASQLTKQMLDYTRKNKPSSKELDVNELIKENAELLRAVVPKRIAISQNLAGNIGKVIADPSQLHQVIMNLITNAAEAISGQGSITISTEVLDFDGSQELVGKFKLLPPKGRYATVVIADDGAGMDEETIARIFEPFYTTKVTGRGLGMSVVMSILENHRGGLAINSELGRGTKMTVLLPVSTADETVTAERAAPQRKAVLVVEDEESMRGAVAGMLSLLGFDAIMARDGEEGLKKLTENFQRISVALVDINMPGQDGISFLRSARGNGLRTPVILTSGVSLPPESRDAEYDLFLKKPFSMAELGMAISMAIAEA